MKQWLNPERTILLVERADGTLTVALRAEPDDIWGPPIHLIPVGPTDRKDP